MVLFLDRNLTALGYVVYDAYGCYRTKNLQLLANLAHPREKDPVYLTNFRIYKSGYCCAKYSIGHIHQQLFLPFKEKKASKDG